MGQINRALEVYEQALAIRREIGDQNGEGIDLHNLAAVFIDERRYPEAIQHCLDSLKIEQELHSPGSSSLANSYLALAHLYSGDLPAARTAAEQARRYDLPENNHNVLALLGVVALRQNDAPAAREAFSAALAHADGLLAHTPELFDALDARALALAGLGQIEDARAAYQAARAINSEAGVVQRASRLLGQLEGVARFWEE